MRPPPILVNHKNVLYGTEMENGSEHDCAAPACTKGGRREARREERRDAILDVAARSFLDHGYAGTTMSGVAQELGGSKGTLWSYFPSKEILFGAVLDRRTAIFREEMSQALNHDEPVAETLGRFCTSFIGKVTTAGAIALHRLVMGEAGRFPELGRIFYERGPLPTLQLLAGFIAGAMERGSLRKDNPFHAAQYLFALSTARSQMGRLTGVAPELEEQQVREESASAVALFMRAYAPD